MYLIKLKILTVGKNDYRHGTKRDNYVTRKRVYITNGKRMITTKIVRWLFSTVEKQKDFFHIKKKNRYHVTATCARKSATNSRGENERLGGSRLTDDWSRRAAANDTPWLQWRWRRRRCGAARRRAHTRVLSVNGGARHVISIRASRTTKILFKHYHYY